MPYTDKNGNRDYVRERELEEKRLGEDENGNEVAIKQRSKRNIARQDAIKQGLVAVGDKKEVDHKTPLSKGGGNGKGNTRVVSQETNRKKYNKQA